MSVDVWKYPCGHLRLVDWPDTPVAREQTNHCPDGHEGIPVAYVLTQPNDL